MKAPRPRPHGASAPQAGIPLGPSSQGAFGALSLLELARRAHLDEAAPLHQAGINVELRHVVNNHGAAAQSGGCMGNRGFPLGRVWWCGAWPSRGPMVGGASMYQWPGGGACATRHAQPRGTHRMSCLL